MIDQLIRTIKGILPDETWDFIFEQFEPHEMRFRQPQYTAVRVSKDYVLVKVAKADKTA